MEDKLYDYMDWAEIEAVQYSEEKYPRNILGPRTVPEGILVQCYFPGEEKVYLKTLSDKRCHPMTEEDSGFFAILLPGQTIPKYTFVLGDKKTGREVFDPYAFPCQITTKEEARFNAGICYDIYEKLGAHPMTIDGVQGVYFAVWAPNAMRVSVVGDFNNWDGRTCQMHCLDSGIFELFVPGLQKGALYKYEIKAKGELTYLKADPYANGTELRPDTASVVEDLSAYQWQDQAWMKQREQKQSYEAPMFVYEVHLGSWRKPGEEDREFYTYRELAPMLAEYVKEMGYTHIELMPVMEHPLDESWGYQVTGYYAPTSRYGRPEDFMYFMDYMHREGIGVILDWVPAHFPRDTFGLAAFDGTCLYEHLDPRKGSHPHWGTLIYNYGRPEVRNFLIANALFWADKYHADGIRMDAVASMLYLDYGKQDGEWVANIYGGNENLEAIEFLKHLNSIFKKKYPSALLIAEESTAWPRITGDLEEEGLGFDYKWNMGWMNDFLGYMGYDPVFRGTHHDELTFSMIYNYSERFLLSFSHDEVVHGKGTLVSKMPGEYEQKLANLRLAFGYLTAHPGKKLIFMGQDFAQDQEWNEKGELDWKALDYPQHVQMKAYMKALLQLYRSCPALYREDFKPEGFEWINCLEWEKNLLIFLRKTEKEEDTLLVVCNFSNVLYEDYQIGVPYPGKYKEIFNSDAAAYGGGGQVNPRVKMSRDLEWDERKQSIKVKIPPLGMAVFQYTKVVEKISDNKTAKGKKRQAARKRDLKKELQEKMEKEEK